MHASLEQLYLDKAQELYRLGKQIVDIASETQRRDIAEAINHSSPHLEAMSEWQSKTESIVAASFALQKCAMPTEPPDISLFIDAEVKPPSAPKANMNFLSWPWPNELLAIRLRCSKVIETHVSRKDQDGVYHQLRGPDPVANAHESIRRLQIAIERLGGGLVIYRRWQRRKSFVPPASYDRRPDDTANDSTDKEANRPKLNPLSPAIDSQPVVGDAVHCAVDDTAKSVSDAAPKNEKPSWNKQSRELWIGAELITTFKKPAPNQSLILDAIEEMGWVSNIPDPLPRKPDIDPIERLKNAVRELNRRQKNLEFERDGTGKGINWRFRDDGIF